MRDAERLELPSDFLDDVVDFFIGTRAGPVDRPRREDGAEAVERLCGAQNSDELRVTVEGGAGLERVPERRPLRGEDGGLLSERPVDAADEFEDVVDALRLRLRVPDQCRAQAPVVRARPFREVDEPGKCWWFDLGGHFPQRTTTPRPERVRRGTVRVAPNVRRRIPWT